MTRQGSLFRPGSANREEAVPIQARLLARKTDPATSKQAAKRVVRSGRQGLSLRLFRLLLKNHGPLTAKQAGALTKRPDFWQVEFCKRTDGWMKAGHIRVALEPSGRERTVDGSRVWEVEA